MKVSDINGPAQSITFRNQSKQDNYEKNIQKQIAALQEKMRNIENDKEVPIERKMNAKKEIQEQIQDLHSELQQYQKTDTEKIHNNKHNKSESLRGEDNDEEIFDKNKNVFLILLKPVLHCPFIIYPYTTIRFLYLSMKLAKPCPRVGNKYIDMMISLSRWETAINCALRLLTTFSIIKT